MDSRRKQKPEYNKTSKKKKSKIKNLPTKTQQLAQTFLKWVLPDFGETNDPVLLK